MKTKQGNELIRNLLSIGANVIFCIDPIPEFVQNALLEENVSGDTLLDFLGILVCLSLRCYYIFLECR